MSQATFSITAEDFDIKMFEKIKNYIQGQNAEIFIRIKTQESTLAANQRIESAIEDVENLRNIVFLTY